MTEITEDERRSGRFRAGRVLRDRYEIGEVIGTGGFAVVYAAFDRTIERPVAIKVLNAHRMAGAGEDVTRVLDRFRREARAAARVSHPSVVEIHDFGVLDDDQPFLVMELLEGHDLKTELRDTGAVAPARLLPLFCEALDALAEAHEQGVVHKDLKPANLFLVAPGTRRERLKIVDFGTAHVTATNEERLTETGYVMGTPQYLAPEYIDRQLVSPAMDIYQMGLILVEALTGQAAVTESNLYQAVMKHMERDFQIDPELLAGPLGPIIEIALATDPAGRYESAEAFSDALAQVDTDAAIFVAPSFVVGNGVGSEAPTEIAEAPTVISEAPQNMRPPNGDRSTEEVATPFFSASKGVAIAVAIVLVLAVVAAIYGGDLLSSPDAPTSEPPVGTSDREAARIDEESVAKSGGDDAPVEDEESSDSARQEGLQIEEVEADAPDEFDTPEGENSDRAEDSSERAEEVEEAPREPDTPEAQEPGLAEDRQGATNHADDEIPRQPRDSMGEEVVDGDSDSDSQAEAQEARGDGVLDEDQEDQEEGESGPTLRLAP